MLSSDAEEKEVLGVLTRKPTEKKAELKSWEPATLGCDFTQKAERETRSLNDPPLDTETLSASQLKNRRQIVLKAGSQSKL